MNVKFTLIDAPQDIYEGELSEFIEGVGIEAVRKRELRIEENEETKKSFSKIRLNEFATVIIEGNKIDFYKVGYENGCYLFATHL